VLSLTQCYDSGLLPSSNFSLFFTQALSVNEMGELNAGEYCAQNYVHMNIKTQNFVHENIKT